MPRKPKLPPFEIVVQGLSTGEPVGPKTFVDDLSGEVMPMAEPYGPFRPPMDLMAKRDAKRKQVRANQLEMLKVLGIVPSAESTTPKPKAGPFKRRI